MKQIEVSDATKYWFSSFPRVMSRVMRCSAHAKLAYMALLDHANDNGSCYPRIELLAEETGISGRAVQRALTELVGRHILRVERRYRYSNLYTLLDPSLWRLTDEEQALFEQHRKELGYNLPGSAYADSQSGSMRTHSPDYVDSQSGSMRTHSQVYADSQSAKEEPVKKNQERRTRKEEAPLIIPPGGFQTFMLAYPKKSHEQQALEEWTKLDPDEALASHIVACVERAKSSEQWRKRMIPYAYKYLRDKCWLDDMPLLSASQQQGSNESCWMFNRITRTFSKVVGGEWVEQPMSAVPDHLKKAQGIDLAAPGQSAAALELVQTMPTIPNDTTHTHTYSTTDPDAPARGP